MKQLIIFTVGAILTIGAIAMVLTVPVEAQIGVGGAQGGVEAARGDGVPTNLALGDGSLVSKIINFMLYAIGIISVVMLIVGGFRYVISGGKKESVTAAKNTILYAIIGLLIAIFAYPIIKFVVDFAIGGGSTTNI